MKQTNNSLNQISLLLGSNLGDKVGNIVRAEKEMCQFLNIIKYSSFYESNSWGYQSINSFVNRAILVESIDSPIQLLNKIQAVEKKVGRVKNQKKGYQDRLIDIDIINFNDEQITLPNLIIPHPRIAERKFTILPLLDLYEEAKIPGVNLSSRQLLENCSDKNEVKKIDV
tara:strand:+ start:1086 stop:1595 length:510 start_codon:yes stop_codon:yes gene_type:complete